MNDKKLKLGLVNNAVGQARNFAGMSDENSRNLATFKAKLENMRNAVLLLNKGVQTEGDAVRAMNEMMANINDPEVVKQRLEEIRALNQRAVMLKKNNIDVLRRNYNQEDLDFGGYENQPPATNIKNRGAEASWGGGGTVTWNGKPMRSEAAMRESMGTIPAEVPLPAYLDQIDAAIRSERNPQKLALLQQERAKVQTALRQGSAQSTSSGATASNW
jgi:hypothetical protein